MKSEHMRAVQIMAECGKSESEIFSDENWPADRPRLSEIQTLLDVKGRRMAGNHFITYNGANRTISEWSRIYGIPRQTISLRLENKWPLDAVFTKKARKRNKRKEAA